MKTTLPSAVFRRKKNHPQMTQMTQMSGDRQLPRSEIICVICVICG